MGLGKCKSVGGDRHGALDGHEPELAHSKDMWRLKGRSPGLPLSQCCLGEPGKTNRELAHQLMGRNSNSGTFRKGLTWDLGVVQFLASCSDKHCAWSKAA